MPLNFAQWTGIAVTFIVVSGSDIDMMYAVPLGLFAGAIATFCSTIAEYNRPVTRETIRTRLNLSESKKPD